MTSLDLRIRRNACNLHLLIASAVIALLAAPISRATPSPTENDGTVHVPAFDLPLSSLLDAKTRAALLQPILLDEAYKAAFKAVPEGLPPKFSGAEMAAMPGIRAALANAFYQTDFYKKLREEFPVVLTSQQIGGVQTETFVPAEGVAPQNRDRVLINLHGGGFMGGARIDSHFESIPIAVLGRIKVISVDYRQAPEFSFPAASEDVAAVYREVLKEYAPENIGIYGSSAGGLLTSQAVAWFIREHLPLPGAVGMFCGGGDGFFAGDSGIFVAALGGYPIDPKAAAGEEPPRHYFTGVSPTDPLAFPIRSESTIKQFPPSLLIGATRDQCLSSVIHMHSRLVANGIDAQLNVWEGLRHCFYFDPWFPASREVYPVVVRFFAEHLGKGGSATTAPASKAKE